MGQLQGGCGASALRATARQARCCCALLPCLAVNQNQGALTAGARISSSHPLPCSRHQTRPPASLARPACGWLPALIARASFYQHPCTERVMIQGNWGSFTNLSNRGRQTAKNHGPMNHRPGAVSPYLRARVPRLAIGCVWDGWRMQHTRHTYERSVTCKSFEDFSRPLARHASYRSPAAACL